MQGVKQIITPIKKIKVEIKDFVSGFDQEQIDIASGYTDDENALPPVQRANRKSLEILVKSVDGQTDGIVDKVLGMDLRDYNFVVAELNQLTDPLPQAKKKTSKKDT